MKNSRYYPFERNRYFYGKLLTVRDFDSEQKYVNDKRRLVNRLLFGSGVLSGLHVVPVDDKTISVEAGVALDCSGREIVVASPVTQKLSMIEGFINNEYAKNVYLCIAYDEKGKEPVHSVASSSTGSEEVSEYNRIQESYKLFVKEDAPDLSSIGLANLVEDISLVYQDKNVRIWQKTPRFVNSKEMLEVTLKVEKTLQTPKVELEYEIASEYFYPADGSGNQKIFFSEPDYGHETEYEIKYMLNVKDAPDTMGTLKIKDGSVKLQIGDKQLYIESDCTNTVQIIEGSVKDKILQGYLNRSLEQSLECDSEPCIYLAKISLLHMGSTFIIEKVENVPFGEYVYNTSDLYRLGLMEKNDDSNHFSSQLTQVDKKEQVSVTPDLNNTQLNSQLKDSQDKSFFEEVETGTAVIELEANAKAGNSYFSEEIKHGLGLGPVFVIVGLEETVNISSALEQYSEQIFFGAHEVFQDSHAQSSIPPLSIGTVVFPKNGTFRVGIKIKDSADIPKIRVRWWAYRKMLDIK